MKRKLRYAVPFSVVAVALTVGSIAWACTNQNGFTYITTPNCLVDPCEAQRGSTIYAHARFVDPNLTLNHYELYLSVQPWCGNDLENAILAFGQMADSDWNIPGAAGTDHDGITDGDGTLHTDVAGVIPRTWDRGTYEVCFNNGKGIDLSYSSYSTSPVALTIKNSS